MSFSQYKPTKVEHFLFLSVFCNDLSEFIGSAINGTVGAILSLLTTVYFLWLLFSRSKQWPFTGNVKFLFTLLFLWTFIITVVTLLFYPSYLDSYTLWYKIRTILISPSLIPFVLPFFLFLLKRNYVIDFSFMLRYIYVFSVIYLLLLPLAFKNMLNFNYSVSDTGLMGEGYSELIHTTTFGIGYILPPTIMIFFKKYLKKTHWYVFMFCIIGNILINAYMARRGGLFLGLLSVFIFVFLYLKNTSLKNRFIGVLGVGLITILVFLWFINSSDSYFSILTTRGFTDTRSLVEQCFYAALSPLDFIVGKGWFASYYDESFGITRNAIETGYLMIILRAGLIYLFLYLSILLLSAIRGIFFSENIFLKSFGFTIIISVVALYPFGWPMFDIDFFMIWLGVYLCNKRSVRKLNDNQIKRIYFG